MKELNAFRKFLTEDQLNENVSSEALAKVYEEEIENAVQNEQDFEIPAYEEGIEMLRQGVHPEKVNDHVQGLLIDITGDYSYSNTALINKARTYSK